MSLTAARNCVLPSNKRSQRPAIGLSSTARRFSVKKTNFSRTAAPDSCTPGILAQVALTACARPTVYTSTQIPKYRAFPVPWLPPCRPCPSHVPFRPFPFFFFFPPSPFISSITSIHPISRVNSGVIFHLGLLVDGGSYLAKVNINPSISPSPVLSASSTLEYSVPRMPR